MTKEQAKEIINNEIIYEFKYSAVNFQVWEASIKTKTRLYVSIGISKCSNKDEYNQIVGMAIAKGRAKKALINALTNKECNHPYMSYIIAQR